MKVSREVEEAVQRALLDGSAHEANKPFHPEDYASEAAFQAEVLSRAKQLGWDGYHPYYSQKSREGYPDLTLWRERVVWMELKSPTGKLTTEQMIVIDRLRKAGAEVYVFRPCDWPKIEEVLNARKDGTAAGDPGRLGAALQGVT